MITPDSFTENDSLDKLVAASLIVRIIVMFVLMVLASVQIFYEYKYQRRSNVINPRMMVLIGIALYTFLRIIYSGILFKTHDLGFASVVVFIRMWVTLFTLQCWIFVGCGWLQLVFILYVSSGVNMENSRRIWIASWVIWIICLLFTLGQITITKLKPDYAEKFFTAGFLSILVLLGGTYATFGVILTRSLEKKEKEKNEKILQIIYRIKLLSFTSIGLLVAALVRDLIFYIILNVPMNSNLRHLSNVLTFLFETIQGIVVMIAVAEEPKNYLYFKMINPSVVRSYKYPAPDPYGQSMQIGNQRKNNSDNTVSTASSSSSSDKETSKVLKQQKPKQQQTSFVPASKNNYQIKNSNSTHNIPIDVNDNTQLQNQTIDINDDNSKNNNDNSNNGDIELGIMSNATPTTSSPQQ